jgi:hypothetical protein
LGDFSKFNTHSQNAVDVISAVVQTSFKHGKPTFLKLCLTKKMWEMKLPFTSQNPFVIWSFHAKVMDKFQKKGMKMFEVWMFFELYS